MLPYPFVALFSVFIFSLAHFFAGKTSSLKRQALLLSTGGGIAIAYVFIDLLPKLAKTDLILTNWLSGFLPYFEKHAYIMALLGFLLFFLVGQAPRHLRGKTSLYLSLTSYAFFNYLIGYAVVDKDDPEVQPLLLFTFALTLHFLVNDYAMRKEHPNDYLPSTRWVMIASLLLGWLTGAFYTLSVGAVSMISAFIGGGVILNVTRHELPSDNPNNIPAFILGALAYTALLLLIGNR